MASSHRQLRARKQVDDPEEHPEKAPAHRQRGRPSKGGQTTKIAGTDAAAAEQLDQELQSDLATSVPSKRTAKRKRNDTTDDPPSTSQGRQYWLLKAEQDDREVVAHSGKTINAKFTIDDLESRTEPEPWDGVRNVVARNNMRAMKQGDLAFFYGSGGKKPGITGIMEIVKEHEPDWTVADPNAYGYAEPTKRGTKDKPQWSLVHVEFRKKLAEPVTLKKLQEYSAPDKQLNGMQVLTHSRISVSKVTSEQWDFITGTLISEEV